MGGVVDTVLNAPIIGALGGVGVVAYLMWQVFRLQTDVITPYRDENERLHLRVASLEGKLQEVRDACAGVQTQLDDCVREREGMEMVEKRKGQHWEPGHWGDDA